ncbi:ABC transporter substrate-binding protein [Gottfriedia luciferensis]|uniref:ABC transporter substrate-binding protein n=1 Tax=Gottfriedia luciferensis TaxID=178774 RepID=UPI000B430E81|nr:ABC transporter substrate-binding protein [Gottfriedia luciferensis]
MKLWKPVVSALASIMVLGLTGCGSDNSEKVSNSDSSSLKGKTITVGSWKGTEAEVTTWDKLLNDFEKTSGIHVKKKIYNDYETQLQTDLVGGTAPDVFYVDAFLSPSLSEKGVLEPLDKYISGTKDFEKNDFFSPAFNAFKGSDNKQYGIPKDYSTLGLYYNEKLLKDAGLSSENIPATSEELPAFLQQLKDKLPKGVVPALTTSELARHMFLLQTEGTKITDSKGYAVLSKDDQLKNLQPLVDAYKNGLVKRAADLGQGWSGDSFGAGKAAIMIEGNWAIAHLKQNFPGVKFGTKEVPTIGGKKGSMMFTVSYAMNSQSQQKAASWEFIKYVTGKTGMKTWAEGAGVLPSRQSVADAINIKNDTLKAPFLAAGSYATPWQQGDTLSIVAREYNNLLPAALKGDLTLKEAMKKAEDAANKDIKTQLNK